MGYWYGDSYIEDNPVAQPAPDPNVITQDLSAYGPSAYGGGDGGNAITPWSYTRDQFGQLSTMAPLSQGAQDYFWNQLQGPTAWNPYSIDPASTNYFDIAPLSGYSGWTPQDYQTIGTRLQQYKTNEQLETEAAKNDPLKQYVVPAAMAAMAAMTGGALAPALGSIAGGADR